MTRTNIPPTRVSKRPFERNAEKCNFCRIKKTKCLPRHRNWSAREKCLPCQRGGQECGPNVRFNNGSSGTSLPRTAGLLLPRPASTDSDINPFAPSDTNPNQDSQHIEPPPTTGFTLAGSARTGAEARDGSVSHFAQTTLPRSPQLLKSGEELEQRDHASKLSTRLGHLRTILEHIRALQRSFASHIETKEASRIGGNLEFYVQWIKAIFEDALRSLLMLAGNENAAGTKLIYREAAELTEAADCGRGEFPKLRAEILRRLISIYREDANLLVVKRLLVQLACLGCPDKTVCDSQAASDLAECYEATATEVGRVFDDINLTIDPPLHRNPETPFPPVHHALRDGHDEVIRLLLENAATLKDYDMLRQTALIVAAALGKTTLFEPAFRRDPTLLQDRDSQGRPPLFHAAYSGEFESFSKLAEAGAELNDRDFSSQSILQVAAASGSIATVSYLLGKGVSPNDDRTQRTSPLHEAARKGHEGVCKLLLEYGAWANYRLIAGGDTAKTPAEIAMDNNFPALSALIERAASSPKNDIYFRYSHLDPNQPPHRHPYQHPLQYSPEHPYHHAHLQPQQAQEAASASNHQSPLQSSNNDTRTHLGPGSGAVRHSPIFSRTPEISHHATLDHQPLSSHGSGSFHQSTPDTPSDQYLWGDNAVSSSPTKSCPITRLRDVGSVS